MIHIAAARAALLLIWPDGEKCQHEHARTAFKALDAAEKRDNELVEALQSMCHQYLSVSNGKLHHDFMRSGEAAFDVLGWDDDGHQLEASCLCEVPGCGAGWSCGANGKDGKYHTFCSPHFSARSKRSRLRCLTSEAGCNTTAAAGVEINDEKRY